MQSQSVQQTEDLFVDALEQWRKAKGLTQFVLLGHSFGGYIAALYSVKYGQHVSQLVLASPLGLPERDAGNATRWKARMGGLGFTVFRYGWETLGINAQALLRGLGPLGPMVTWRGYILRRFNGRICNGEMIALADYWFHTNAGRPGVYGHKFMSLLYAGAFARLPLQKRLDSLAQAMPMVLVYGGSGDWMGPDSGRALAGRLTDLCGSRGHKVDVHLVPDAGHQLFLENPQASAAMLLQVIR
jgi:pimeloyl-ACP methyl ester carboxylesterase